MITSLKHLLSRQCVAVLIHVAYGGQIKATHVGMPKGFIVGVDQQVQTGG